MNFEANVRKLARSNYWQTIFRTSKELSGVQLFDNNTNFSGIQVTFLYWLRIYDMLFSEMAEFEWDVLDERIIEDDQLCDAFLYYRRVEINKKLREYASNNKKESRKQSKAKNLTEYPIYQGPTKGEQ